MLPTKEEAAEYFARFRTPASLNPDRMIMEEEVVQGMVDELHMVMKSVRFSAATIVRVFQSSCFLLSACITGLKPARFRE